MEFSVDGLKRIIRGNSDKHVSPSAAKELNDELEEYAETIAKEAWRITQSRGRDTVRSEDIRDAIKQFEK